MNDQSFNYSGNGIDIHLSYEYLTVKDLANILKAINGLYESLTELFIYQNLEYSNGYEVRVYPLPICLEEIHTGNSVIFNIKFNKKFFPNLNVEGNNIELELPKWSVIVLLTGYILSFGVDKWEQLESIRNTVLDSHLKEMEIAEKMHNNNIPNVNKVKQNFYEWNQIIQKDTFKKVVVNGHDVKNKK